MKQYPENPLPTGSEQAMSGPRASSRHGAGKDSLLHSLQEENERLRRELQRLRGATEPPAAPPEGQEIGAILDHLPAMVGYWDRDLRNRFGNRAYAAWFGIAPEQMAGRHLREVIGEDLYRLNRPFLEAALAGQLQTFERSIPRPDGSGVRHSLTNYIPDFQNGKVQGIFVLVADISLVKEAGLHLQASEERYRTVVQDQGELISRLRTDGSYLFANEVYCRFFGKSLQEVLDGRWQPLVHADDLDRVNSELAALSPDNPLVMIENRVIAADGKVHWMQFSNRGTFAADRRLLEIQSVGRDISDRKAAEEALRASESWFRGIFENANTGIAAIDAGGRLVRVNGAFQRMLGYPAEVLAGMHIADFTHPDDRQPEQELIDDVLARRRESYRITKRYLAADGRMLWADIFVTAIRDAQGEVSNLVGLVHEITEQKRAEADLRIATAAFESQEGMMITDADNVILRVNRAFTRISGYPAEELVGRQPSILKSGRHDNEFYRQMWESINTRGGWEGEIWDRRKNGDIYPKWLTITAMKGEKGEISHYIATHVDISERKNAEEKIKTLAFFDQLTGLPNRTLLLDRLKQARATSARNGNHAALLFIDLDNFKALNDTLGHEIGDLLLQQVAQRLKNSVREGDTVARLGGDEFVVVLLGLSGNEAEAATNSEVAAENILGALGQVYALGELMHHSSASIGVTLFRGDRTSVDDLMKQADLAMYRAKAAGRNTVRFFDPALEFAAKERVALEGDLRSAIEEKQFLLHYQAQVDGEGRLAGAEALVRWQHPRRGRVSPAEFIPLAEETGLIVPLGQWVLASACAQLAAWARDPALAALTLAVNVSPRQFRQPDFVEQVLSILDASGADPAHLKIELTESLLVENVQEVIEKMSALKARGIGFSLDDFGTGYSSLAYLKRLPLDQLKIDQSFVRDVLDDPNDAVIAKAVIALAQSLGLEVIAEGVETQEQREFLAAAGCHAYQGYLFSRPLAVDEFASFARAAVLPSPD